MNTKYIQLLALGK